MVAPKVASLSFDAALLVAFLGVQNSARYCQFERNTMNRAVSSRCWPRRIIFTALDRLS